MQEPQPQPPHDRPTHRETRLEYFQPGQVVLHVEHTGEFDRERLERLLKRLEPELEPLNLRWRAASSPPIVTFPAVNGPSFSLATAEVEGADDDPDRLIALLIRLDARIGDGLSDGDVLLRTAAPNWLTSGAPEQIGTGGPGAAPVKALPPSGGAPFIRNFPPPAGTSWSDGSGVHVAILDTAPAIHAIVSTYYEWRTYHPGAHPLLESLLGPHGPLQVYPATAGTLHRLASYHLQDERYLMTDHGLFVAGIIHQLAPRAQLHLFEVLNPYGVGDLQSIAGGLQQALQLPRNTLVINCSLVFNLPLAGQGDPGCLDPVRATHPHLLRRWAQPIEALCLWVQGYSVPMVAAAGNDAQRNRRHGHAGRPSARYPAAFESVIGVGALPRDAANQGLVAASYSNLSDRPERAGFITLGGEAGPENGVLGLYIGHFPDGQPNDTKWAWWAGTSFATPIVTGLVASLRGGGLGGQLPVVTGALAQLSTAQTAQHEMALNVTQP
jgi:hypothetical protein